MEDKFKTKGKVIKILDVKSGTSKKGTEWQNQTFVIDDGSQYNSTLAIDVFGDKIQQLNSLSVGDEVEVEVNVGSREYQGRYFHNVGLWNMSKVETMSQENREKVDLLKNKTGLNQETHTPIPEENDDLPF